jgi:hypothetical protein
MDMPTLTDEEIIRELASRKPEDRVELFELLQNYGLFDISAPISSTTPGLPEVTRAVLLSRLNNDVPNLTHEQFMEKLADCRQNCHPRILEVTHHTSTRTLD